MPPPLWQRLLPIPKRLIQKPDKYLAAVGWIMLSCLFMTILQVLLRMVMEHMHPFQATFCRNFVALLWVIPTIIPMGIGPILRADKRMHLFRGVVGTMAMLLVFYALSVLPLAEAVTLSFLAPLFATFGAAVFLGEKVRIRRWTGVILGLVGTLIMLRPWGGVINLGVIAGVISAMLIAVSTLLIKYLAGRDPIRVTLFYAGLIMTPLSLPAALATWQSIDVSLYPLLAAVGLSAVLVHATLTRSFGLADASSVMPFDFTRLPLWSPLPLSLL